MTFTRVLFYLGLCVPLVCTAPLALSAQAFAVPQFSGLVLSKSEYNPMSNSTLARDFAVRSESSTRLLRSKRSIGDQVAQTSKGIDSRSGISRSMHFIAKYGWLLPTVFVNALILLFTAYLIYNGTILAMFQEHSQTLPIYSNGPTNETTFKSVTPSDFFDAEFCIKLVFIFVAFMLVSTNPFIFLYY